MNKQNIRALRREHLFCSPLHWNFLCINSIEKKPYVLEPVCLSLFPTCLRCSLLLFWHVFPVLNCTGKSVCSPISVLRGQHDLCPLESAVIPFIFSSHSCSWDNLFVGSKNFFGRPLVLWGKIWSGLAALFGEGNGTPLQYSCLENPMDGGAWWAAVHGVSTSWTGLSHFTFSFHFDALEAEMATPSSVLAWRIPGTGEPGGLLSVGLHRVTTEAA